MTSSAAAHVTTTRLVVTDATSCILPHSLGRGSSTHRNAIKGSTNSRARHGSAVARPAGHGHARPDEIAAVDVQAARVDVVVERVLCQVQVVQHRHVRPEGGEPRRTGHDVVTTLDQTSGHIIIPAHQMLVRTILARTGSSTSRTACARTIHAIQTATATRTVGWCDACLSPSLPPPAVSLPVRPQKIFGPDSIFFVVLPAPPAAEEDHMEQPIQITDARFYDVLPPASAHTNAELLRGDELLSACLAAEAEQEARGGAWGLTVALFGRGRDGDACVFVTGWQPSLYYDVLDDDRKFGRRALASIPQTELQGRKASTLDALCSTLGARKAS